MSEQVLIAARKGRCSSCGSGKVVPGRFKTGYMKPYLEYRLCLDCRTVWFHTVRPERVLDLFAVGISILLGCWLIFKVTG